MEKKHLTLQDRQNIEQMLNAKKNFVEIALALNKNKSTTTMTEEEFIEECINTLTYYFDNYNDIVSDTAKTYEMWTA